jgi:AcrR family transcriptional regulator
VNRASYNSPRRQQAAAATREAIIEAALELFACQGYARTTVAQIAEAARVAANTVYTSVGGKPQLLAAITEGGTGDPDVAETLTAVARTTDPAEVIRLTAAGTRRVNERRAKAVAVLLDSAQADPAGAEMLRVTVRHYRDALATLVRRLEDLGAVQPPDLDRAADVFWYLFGWTSWRTLITDLGWSWDDAEQWLAERGVEALLEPARPKPQALWAAAHPTDEITHVDPVRHGPRRHPFAVNRVGQVTQGLVGHLRQSCCAQHVNHMLPGELHRNHPRLNVGLALDADLAAEVTPSYFRVILTKLTVDRLLSIVKW